MITSALNELLTKNENLPLILSIIGCVTGCAGLLINFYKFLSERTKIKIHRSPEQNIFFDKLPGYETYDTQYQGFISIRIINKSALPITFYKLDIRQRFKQLPCGEYHSDTFNFIGENSPKHKTSSEITVKPAYDFPLRIEPLDVFEGHVFISEFPTLAKDKTYISIKLYSSRKNFFRITSIHKVETKVCNSDDDYKQENQ